MYTPEQVVELVEAAYERGFSAGSRSAFDTVAFIDGYYESGVGETSDTAGEVNTEPDGTEYDAMYLEVTGQKVDDLLERVVGLERFVYGTPGAESDCGPDCLCKR